FNNFTDANGQIFLNITQYKQNGTAVENGTQQQNLSYSTPHNISVAGAAKGLLRFTRSISITNSSPMVLREPNLTRSGNMTPLNATVNVSSLLWVQSNLTINNSDPDDPFMVQANLSAFENQSVWQNITPSTVELSSPAASLAFAYANWTGMTAQRLAWNLTQSLITNYRIYSYNTTLNVSENETTQRLPVHFLINNSDLPEWDNRVGVLTNVLVDSVVNGTAISANSTNTLIIINTSHDGYSSLYEGKHNLLLTYFIYIGGTPGHGGGSSEGGNVTCTNFSIYNRTLERCVCIDGYTQVLNGTTMSCKKAEIKPPEEKPPEKPKAPPSNLDLFLQALRDFLTMQVPFYIPIWNKLVMVPMFVILILLFGLLVVIYQELKRRG
ncbi:MAG: hypothetical protein WC759_00170, partial [Candidatus Micrarchaeia archaeon]